MDEKESGVNGHGYITSPAGTIGGKLAGSIGGKLATDYLLE